MRNFLILIALILTTSLAAAGVRYEAETVTGAAAGGGVVEAWVDGPSARIVFKDDSNPVMGQGTWLVTKDGGQNLYQVNPEEKTYTRWDLDALLKQAGGLLQSLGGIVKFEIEDAKSVKELDEASEPIHGLRTRHYRHRTSYTIKVKIFGMTRESQVETSQETWSTSALDDVALGVWLRTSPTRTGIEDVDQLIELEMSKIQGFPLKSITRTVETTNGETSTYTTTMTVTALERLSVPSSTFEIPADFQEVEAPSLTDMALAAQQGQAPEPGPPVGASTRPEAESDAPAAEPAVEPESKKELLKGLFGKAKKRAQEKKKEWKDKDD